jgi:hypothetical protein
MGYAGFSANEISHALLPRSGGAGMGAAVEVMRTRRIIHEASLAQFLLFVNLLSSDCPLIENGPDNFAIQSRQMSHDPYNVAAFG